MVVGQWVDLVRTWRLGVGVYRKFVSERRDRKEERRKIEATWMDQL